MPKKYVLKRTSDATPYQLAIDESRFRINYKEQLNAAQFEAVSSLEGAYLVIAGAGSGKTRTLVYRVARLTELGYDPSSILLLTFTRKAAKEMLDRATILLDNRCSKINGGTFHSFANLTLRKYAKAINLDNGFTILDQGDSEDVINLIRTQLNLSQHKKRFPNKTTIFKVLSLSVNTGRSVEGILDEDFPHFEEYTDKFLDIQKVYSAYKQKNNLLDYDDLLLYLLKFLMDQSSAAKSFLSTLDFVMVDEYQDTNHLQSQLIKGLTQIHRNIMVVGDDSQSIYSFRGANFKNIMEFPTEFKGAQIITLEENYRSTQEILNFSNHIIEHAIEKYPKHLFTRKIGGELPGIISAANENMQSRFIVERILELREEGVPLNDMAVLFRSSFHSFNLEIELNKANIPYIKFGGMKFIETAHVKDLLAFLRIAANPNDYVSWYRILLLHEGIGPKKAQAIMDEMAAAHLTIKGQPEALISKKYSDKIYNLFTFLHEIHTKNQLPADKAELAYKYYEPLFTEKYDDYNKRKKDLDIFINIAENYRSLESFLSDMALEPPRDSVIDVESPDNEREYLTLSTIHSAKGLEWHTVFILHAIEGFFPSSQSFDKFETLEEERRLMYVASTRAKQNLYVCYPMHIFDRQNGMTFSKPSRFIEGINESMADQWLLEER
jgi:DNA helicase II / ATP-dependent DNA helicase PcrA